MTTEPSTSSDSLNDLLPLLNDDLRREIRDLQRYKQVLFDSLPYQPGTRVALVDDFHIPQFIEPGKQHGWWHYRECLVPGATGEVLSCRHNSYSDAWYAEVRFDREWSVSETRRYAHQDHRHTFSLRFDRLRLATDTDSP